MGVILKLLLLFLKNKNTMQRTYTMLTIFTITLISLLTITVDVFDPGFRETLSKRYESREKVTWGKVGVYDGMALRKRFFTMDSADSIKLFAGFGAPEPLNVGNNVTCSELNAPSGEVCIVNHHLAPYGACFTVASGCTQMSGVIGWYVNTMANAGSFVIRQNSRAFMYNVTSSTDSLQSKLDSCLLSGAGDAYHFEPCLQTDGTTRPSDFCALASKQADYANWPSYGRGYYEVMDGTNPRQEGITATGDEKWLFDAVYIINVAEQFDLQPDCAIGAGICSIGRTTTVTKLQRTASRELERL